MQPRKTYPVTRATAAAALALAVATVNPGCSQLPGGLVASGQTLKGRISGSGLGSKTKIGVMSGTFLPSQLANAEVVNVAADGSWSYPIPAGRDTLTVFAFVDSDGNGKYEASEVNSYESSKCPNCGYVVATLVGDTWTVSIKRSGTSSSADLSSANMQFDAAAS